MTSLYRRATPSQAFLLRAIEGAVKNAHDAHPEKEFCPRMARSIAKRAAGTLSAQWPEVLAARSAPSEAGSGIGSDPVRRRPSHFMAAGVRSPQSVMANKRGTPQDQWRSPLRRLWKQLAALAGEAKRAGNEPRLEAIVEILRTVDRMQREGGRP